MTVKSDQILDVRGKSCPIPVLMTRDKLRTMKSGEILEVIGDFPQAKDNICRFVEKEGNLIKSIIDNKTCYQIFIVLK